MRRPGKQPLDLVIESEWILLRFELDGRAVAAAAKVVGRRVFGIAGLGLAFLRARLRGCLWLLGGRRGGHVVVSRST